MKKSFKIFIIFVIGIFLITACGKSDNEEYKEQIKYTVIFMNNGEQLEKRTIKNDELIKRPVDPIKEGYVFSHWATHEKSTDGSEVFDFTIAPNKSVTLFAHFIEESKNNKSDRNNLNENTKKPSNSSNNNTTKKPSNNSKNNPPTSKPNNNSNTNNTSSNKSNNNLNNNTTTKPSNNNSSNNNTNNSNDNNTIPSVSVSKQNALKSAKSYLNVSAFSRQGLIEQLEYEKYSNEDAVYAVDNCGANWNEQALKSAKSYLRVSAFSYSGLIEQLEYEGFTSEQTKYGVNNCGADWNEQAVKSAKSYLKVSAFSRQGLIEQLLYEGFTQAQAEYGVSQNGL